MSIVYESEWATVIHGDARDVLPGYRWESVDLIATDPPYGMKYQSGRRVEQFDTLFGDADGDRAMIHDIMRECVRVVGQHRHLYVFGPPDTLDGLKVAEVVELVWDKGRHGSGDVTAPWGPQHERISFTVSKHRHAGQTGARALPARIRKGSVLGFSPVAGTKLVHPSQKPLGLMRELIESSTRQGELVLDPFGGAGSTATAAILCGRRAITIEIDEQWIPVTVDRVRQAEALAKQALSI